MKITDIKKENNKVIFTIQPDSKNWVDELSKTKKRLAKNIAIPGFRKGHAPQKVIDQSITINQVISSTLDKFINEIANKFIKEEAHKHEDIIVGSLKVDLKTVNDSNITLSFIFEKQPTIELNGYDKIDFDYQEPTASEKEITAELKNAIKNDLMLSAKEDDTIAKGDMIKFDFEGFIDGKPIEGGEAKDYQLEIGSGQFISGFEEQMVGLKKGAKKTIEVVFPKDYPAEEYRNKKANFNLLIKDISKITYPKLDKAYLSKFNLQNVETEEQFKNYFKNEIIKVKKSMKFQELMKTVNDFVMKNIKYDYLPNYYIDAEVDARKQNYIQQAKNQFNKKLEDAIVDLGFKSMDDFNKKIHQQAIDAIKFNIGMNKLIKQLDVKVTQQDIEKEIIDSSKKLNVDVNELLKNQSILNSIGQYLLNNRIVTKLLELNKKNSKVNK